jgi:O-antigen/teichoic acid export membrane protein
MPISGPIQIERHVVILSSLTDRYTRVGWAIADQMLVSGASFGTTLLVARFLGKEEFGRFVLAWLAVWIVQNLQIALITTPITTFAMREPRERQPAYFGAICVQQVGFAAITTVLVYMLAAGSGRVVPSWRLDEVAGPLACVIAFGQIADIQRRYFYINERTSMTFGLDLSRCGTQIVGLLALFLLFPSNASLYSVLIVIAASALLGALVGWAFTRPFVFEWGTIKDVTQKHWSFARWLLGSTLINCARESFVSISVGGLLGLTEIGVLRAVQQLVLIINIPLFVMHNTVPAPASRAYGERGFPGLWGYMKGFALKYAVFLCAVLAVIGALGEQLLTAVYGRGYAGYGWLVTVYAAIMIIFLIRDFMAIMVKTTEKTDFDFYASVLGAALSFALLFPLIRKFGLAGALLTEALMHAGMLVIIARGLKSHWRDRGGS